MKAKIKNPSLSTKQKDSDQSGNKSADTKGVGRPKKLNERDLDLKKLEIIAAWGHTNEEMAILMDISPATFYNYLKEYPELLETIKRGKLKADTKVIQSLYRRAIGYSHSETKVFLNSKGGIVKADITKQYPPDTAAAWIWTKNRMPGKWRDKIEVQAEVTEKDTYDYNKLNTRELKTFEKLLEKVKVG